MLFKSTFWKGIRLLTSPNDLSEQQNQDEILIKKAMAGDKSAFGMLIGKYRNKLYRVLYFIVHNQEDALDLLQDTLVKAYKSIHTLRSPSAFYCWINRIGVNLAFNFLKRSEKAKKYHEKLALEYREKSEDPLSSLEKKELQLELVTLISQLPAKQKAAFVLCDVEGHSYKEISEILNCNLGTVMSRIYYARNYIRKNISLCNDEEIKNSL